MNAMMWVRGFAADYDEWGEHAGRIVELRAASRSTSNASSSGRLVISEQRSPRSLDRRVADRGHASAGTASKTQSRLSRKDSARPA